ncbi:MAG TPA: 4-(cytidine 5'-diphospho)-2-C-methyl-D-erythritol kinase [Allosphingosinicella sp.]|nr:4-(cytidine 5'-diphospho)-2-C-methyl-D-erythritol kinase [Allosphingosinicella sp.]
MNDKPKLAAGREIAYAKINLALHVRERLPDGYHRIETIFAFCEDGDILTAEPSEELSLEIVGPFAADLGDAADNLVLRAARAVGATAALRLDKRLPVAAGIGGGSADAAAALRLLGRGDAAEIAAALGADVPACLGSRTMRGEGRGDQLEAIELPEIEGRPILLINPRRPLSTPAVFAGWDGVDRGALEDWRDGRNDLEEPALRLVPEIGLVLEALATADIARMSGSGATCFGLFSTDPARDELAARVASDYPDWWIFRSRLRAVRQS